MSDATGDRSTIVMPSGAARRCWCFRLDFKSRTAELEASANPFALVVLAQLAAIATKRNPTARLDRKIGLTRRLYRFGLSRDEVLSLYAFIDWAMTLPEPLEDDDHRAIQAIEEAEQMRYVTTAERIGLRKGMERGLERGLESERALLQRQARRRFGDAVAERAAVLLALIRAPETLEQLGEALLDDADGEVRLTARGRSHRCRGRRVAGRMKARSP